MQLKERPGPPGPYAAPDEIPPPRPDVPTGGTRYADIEYARVMGFRPLRMDLLLPPAPSGPVPVVVDPRRRLSLRLASPRRGDRDGLSRLDRSRRRCCSGGLSLQRRSPLPS